MLPGGACGLPRKYRAWQPLLAPKPPAAASGAHNHPRETPERDSPRRDRPIIAGSVRRYDRRVGLARRLTPRISFAPDPNVHRRTGDTVRPAGAVTRAVYGCCAPLNSVPEKAAAERSDHVVCCFDRSNVAGLGLSGKISMGWINSEPRVRILGSTGSSYFYGVLSHKRCNGFGSLRVNLCYFVASIIRSGKAIVKAFKAPFHRFDQRWRPLPVGSRLMTARYTHLRAHAGIDRALWCSSIRRGSRGAPGVRWRVGRR